MQRLENLDDRGVYKRVCEAVDGVVVGLREAGEAGKQWMEDAYYKEKLVKKHVIQTYLPLLVS